MRPFEAIYVQTPCEDLPAWIRADEPPLDRLAWGELHERPDFKGLNESDTPLGIGRWDGCVCRK